MTPDETVLYLSGPMTGHPGYNFAAFDKARNDLRAAGYAVICPAEMDREQGFNPFLDDWTAEHAADAARRDARAISHADAVAVLPRFTGSRGVRAELALARWIGMPCIAADRPDLDITDAVDSWLAGAPAGNLTPRVTEWLAGRPADVLERTEVAQQHHAATFAEHLVDMQLARRDAERFLAELVIDAAEAPPSPPTSHRRALLEEAADLVDGDRNAQYGDPRQDFQRTAAIWSATLGVDIDEWQVAACMIGLKLSRLVWSPDKRDTWADIAGYAACGWDCARP